MTTENGMYKLYEDFKRYRKAKPREGPPGLSRGSKRVLRTHVIHHQDGNRGITSTALERNFT